MEDYYKLLDIDERWNDQEIASHLMQLNRDYRKRANHRDSAIREDANQKLQQVNRAMARLGPDGDRAAYNQELAGYRAAQELQRPLADVNLYQTFQLPMDATPEQIEAALESVKDQPVGEEKPQEVAARQDKLVALARHVLLDPERRSDYDAQLREKLAFEAEREATKPVPLRINGTEVTDWVQLEHVLDDHPEEGLFLLQDGEIEAWLRWSLGQPLRADWVREIGTRAKQSATAYMELDQLQRLVNGNRPLAVYRVGEGPRRGPVAQIRHTNEIPALADRNWAIFIAQLGYILDWVSVYGDEQVISRLSAYPPSDDRNMVLERLLYCINPQIEAPRAALTGTSNGGIDFGAISNWESPAKSFTIAHAGRGYLFGELNATEPWIALDVKQFAGLSTTVQVSIDRTRLPAGADSQGQVRITLLDGRVPPVVVDVKVSKRTGMQSVKSLFGRKG